MFNPSTPSTLQPFNPSTYTPFPFSFLQFFVNKIVKFHFSLSESKETRSEAQKFSKNIMIIPSCIHGSFDFCPVVSVGAVIKTDFVIVVKDPEKTMVADHVFHTYFCILLDKNSKVCSIDRNPGISYFIVKQT